MPVAELFSVIGRVYLDEQGRQASCVLVHVDGVASQGCVMEKQLRDFEIGPSVEPASGFRC